MPTIIETIGNTPMVQIKKLNTNPNVKIYAKLEGFNPGGSMKDRVALAMIEDAEKPVFWYRAKPSSKPPMATPALVSLWLPPRRVIKP